MGHPIEWRILAKDVEKARDEILSDIFSQWRKVFYVDGWMGFGATAVLKSIAAVLPSRKTTPERCFERIIFMDCSQWRSRRAMQREITKELKLDSSVMAMFDKQDEEDDFRGVDQGSRDVILSVSVIIYQTLTRHRFMMIFLNGSDDEVDVTRFGIPQFTEFCSNKMLWTFSRRCLSMNFEREKLLNNLDYTHVLMNHVHIRELKCSEFHGLLCQEAADILARIPCLPEINPEMVEDCCLYDLFLYLNFHTTTNFSWRDHALNYWICDGIIQGDRVSDICNALRGEIYWKCDDSLLEVVLQMFKKKLWSPFLVLKDDDVYEEGNYRWISVTSRNKEIHGMQTIPAETSSFFLAFERSDHLPPLPYGFFEYSSNLGVLVLCYCSFSFASPPFVKCRGLRFLGLDHCTHGEIAETENHAEWLCLYSLQVLDIRYTEWNEILSGDKIDAMKNIRELNIEGFRCWQYLAELQGRLHNLQSLRIRKPTYPWDTPNDVDGSFIDKTSMEVLDLSGNSYMKILPKSLSKASSLQVLILDGCAGLENIVGLPPSLEAFSFDGDFRMFTEEYKMHETTSKISLEGCTKLDRLLLRGLNNLVELDLSGTAIKILDLNTMVVHVSGLKRLFLIGCKHLIAINSSDCNCIELVCIDTRAGIICPRPSKDRNESFQYQLHAVIVDARMAYSLLPLFKNYLGRVTREHIYFNIHVTSSPVYDGVVQFEETNNDQGGIQQLIPAGQYHDILSTVGNPPMQDFPQPLTTRQDRHIEIAEGSCYVERGLEGALGELTEYHVESLHLHDVSIHDTFTWRPWRYLRWCRVERCPELDTVFPSSSLFTNLETFWASDLLMARWIWSKGRRYNSSYYFKNLRHLHLQSCARVQLVLPVWASSFSRLETLHIIHCGDLVHVFELDEEIFLGVAFPKLTSIHLHDLPKLRQICEVKMMAPSLETIKIRGCWNIRRLPSVTARGRGEKKPTVEIEKEVWDALEWDARHRPDHFEAPIHSRYYKKKLPRVSLLR